MAMSLSTSEMHTTGQPALSFLAGPAIEARARLPEYGDAAMDFHRRSSAGSASRNPLQRIASLLIAISRNNSYEGRDPHAIPDTLTSGFVAQLLGIEVPALAHLLATLEHQGMVARAPNAGLRLTNLVSLERLADAH